MLKFMLNTHKFNNYAFFCPVSKLHLTMSNPVGFVNEVTPAILRAVKANNVIDVNGVIDLKTGTVNEIKQTEETPEVPEVPEIPETPDTPEIPEDPESTEESEASVIPSQSEEFKAPEAPAETEEVKEEVMEEQSKATGKKGGKKVKEAAE